MKIPKVDKGRIVAICAEATTGIVVHNHGGWYLGSGEEEYCVFDTIALARQYAATMTSANSVDGGLEILLYDDEGNFIEVIR